MIHQKESAGGSKTTTADTNHTTKIISLCSRIGIHLMRVVAVLATYMWRLA